MGRILVVEDDPVVGRIVEMALKRAGHVPHLAPDYASAKEALAQGWDLILLDLNLPGGSGLELLRTLRLQEQAPPVLVLSGLKQERTILEALQLGAQDYLTKPFSPHELLLRLERYVAKG